MEFFYIAACVLLTVYGQIVIKWRLTMYDSIPKGTLEKLVYLSKLVLTDPFLISSFFAAFLASLFWMSALTKLTLSFAYPFMSTAFILVMLFSIFYLGEDVNLYKIIGTSLVIFGVVVISRGYT